MIFWVRVIIFDVVVGVVGFGVMDGVVDLDEVVVLVLFVFVFLVLRREVERVEKEWWLDFLRFLVFFFFVEVVLLELLGLKMELSLSLVMLGDFKCGFLLIEVKLNYIMIIYVF